MEKKKPIQPKAKRDTEETFFCGIGQHWGRKFAFSLHHPASENAPKIRRIQMWKTTNLPSANDTHQLYLSGSLQREGILYLRHIYACEAATAETPRSQRIPSKWKRTLGEVALMLDATQPSKACALSRFWRRFFSEPFVCLFVSYFEGMFLFYVYEGIGFCHSLDLCTLSNVQDYFLPCEVGVHRMWRVLKSQQKSLFPSERCLTFLHHNKTVFAVFFPGQT